MAYLITPSETTTSSTDYTEAAYELASEQTQPTLEALLVELRVIAALLTQGLNIPDDPATLRADPYYQNTP